MSVVSLNLGGGAARGFAHVGAIRALQEYGIKFDLLVGISMGAICGGIYCVSPDAEFLERRLKELVNFQGFRDSVVGNWTSTHEENARGIVRRTQKLLSSTNILRRMFTAPGVVPTQDVHACMHPFLADIAMRSTEVPFATAAVNVRSGELKVFSDRDMLRGAVVASASMPLIFPPEKIGSEWYVDGGVLDKLGIETARYMGATKMIVIDVSDEKLPDNIPKSGFDVMLKTEEISSEYRRLQQLEYADLILRPIRGNYHWADYSAADVFIQMGYDCAVEHMPQIKRIANARRVYSLFSKS